MADGDGTSRRLVVGGVPDLLLPHELCDVPTFDPEASVDKLADRLPSEPVLEVPYSGATWWQWCRPRDVIVLDECQRLFRPMASGRRVPLHIAKLETHRHYGVDLVLITQHPQLVHANVRNLVGCYIDVRRLWGTHQTVVYTWDHVTDPTRTSSAQKSLVAHDKKAYSLYKSAEVHTKPRMKIPALILAFPAIVLGAGYAIYAGLSTVSSMGKPPPSIATVQAAASSPQARSVVTQAPQPVQPGASVPANLGSPGACLVDAATCRCADASTVWAVPLSDGVCRISGMSYRLIQPGPQWQPLALSSAHRAETLQQLLASSSRAY